MKIFSREGVFFPPRQFLYDHFYTQVMNSWDPELYLKFGSARTRPARDLVGHIPLDSPKRIVDLGCGPGNSTDVLKARWPETDIWGVDSSGEMLRQAAGNDPDIEWIQADLQDWTPPGTYDLIFSNAALQWIQPVEPLLDACVEALEPGGVLAFQTPCNSESPYYTSILSLAKQTEWADKFQGVSFLRYETTQSYYDLLSGHLLAIDAWETEYFHIMENVEAIVEWISGTGLRPCLDALPNETEQVEFKAQILELYKAAYPKAKDGKVLFPFNRQFFVVQKR